ncbi:MAG: hypothetical protein PHP37_02820, partial [Patescibacteria group bacterium]|nr:hypothetical protein [Patescibacteria group bacterium]
MSFEKNMPTSAKKSGEEASEVSVASLREELASDYKNFKDPNFHFPGGKGELEKRILEKEDQLRSLEAGNKVAEVKGSAPEDIGDYVNNFMQKKARERASVDSSEKIKDAVANFISKQANAKAQKLADEAVKNSAPEDIGANVADFMFKAQAARAGIVGQKDLENKVNKEDGFKNDFKKLTSLDEARGELSEKLAETGESGFDLGQPYGYPGEISSEYSEGQEEEIQESQEVEDKKRRGR